MFSLCASLDVYMKYDTNIYFSTIFKFIIYYIFYIIDKKTIFVHTLLSLKDVETKQTKHSNPQANVVFFTISDVQSLKTKAGPVFD